MHYRLADDAVLDLSHALRTVAERRLAELERVVRDQFGIRSDPEPVAMKELLARARSGKVVILDTRPASEFAAGHIAGALSVPVDELQAHGWLSCRRARNSSPIAAGPTASTRTARWRCCGPAGGGPGACVGGFPEWRAAGLPVEADTRRLAWRHDFSARTTTSRQDAPPTSLAAGAWANARSSTPTKRTSTRTRRSPRPKECASPTSSTPTCMPTTAPAAPRSPARWGPPTACTNRPTSRSPSSGLRDGQEIELGNTKVKVLHTPGHTPESISPGRHRSAARGRAVVRVDRRHPLRRRGRPSRPAGAGPRERRAAPRQPPREAARRCRTTWRCSRRTFPARSAAPG